MLFAEMRAPGRAWLEFRAEPDGPSAVLRQIVNVDPGGAACLRFLRTSYKFRTV